MAHMQTPVDGNAPDGGAVNGSAVRSRASGSAPNPMNRHRVGVTLFLVAALASFLLSIGLWFTDHRQEGVFVGLWVPSILAAGAFWMAAVRQP
jgi:hypothetical protein